MNQASEQIYSLQILRAVAAASVVYAHTFTAPQFGSFGVDLFFVISGFVMYMIVQRPDTTPASFLAARVARIVPLYWAVTTMVLLVAWLAPQLMGTTVANLGDYLKSLLFIPYLRADGIMVPMLMPGWTLNYEMLFYLTILGVLCVGKLAFFWSVSAVLLAYFFLGSLDELKSLDQPESPDQPESQDQAKSLARTFFHTTLWLEFILGMLCHAIHEKVRVWRIPKKVICAALVSFFALLALFEGRADRFLVAGIPSAFIVLFALQLEGALKTLRASVLRALVHLGDASYATYLSHMFVVGVVERILFARTGVEKNIFTAIFTVACALAAGSLIYRLIDRPLSNGARRWIKRLRLPSRRIA
ncbi:acyltransferase family protein [Variovorax fucosicus]|uniref:acyltransferase family protein n=1 Tax=Variovorax fucosicus TaxID=3053517 RepID=UPI002575EF5B|nr:acyltransferase [Variovorax sp. J22G47]MDM0054330.1 acyltransferase [Variovorax sp. J22G47]